MGSGNRMFYPILGFISCLILFYLSFGDLWVSYRKDPDPRFVQRKGINFMVDGKVFYIHGWNSYWLMDNSVDENRRSRAKAVLEAGAKMGLTVCRTWAFNDGGYNALQISPGQYDERVFKALDYVIAEARQNGIRLILSLVNNLEAYGGKTQYVKWAWEEGIGLTSSNDSFFYDPSIRQYFKNHVKTILTRRNSLTGVEYRDDPTIFAWELINEPRCMTDPSGNTLQDWIEEMSDFIKSIDKNHLLTVGLEGFYGPKSVKSLKANPGEWAANLGSDFIRNSNLTAIDFASVHIYPDQWLHGQTIEEVLKYVSKWMNIHIEDGDKVLKKPVMFTEFGWSNMNKGFKSSQRDKLYKTVSEIVYYSAQKSKSGAGSFVWQFFVEGMEEYKDGYGVVPWDIPSMHKLITKHSCRLSGIHGELRLQRDRLKQICV